MDPAHRHNFNVENRGLQKERGLVTGVALLLVVFAACWRGVSRLDEIDEIFVLEFAVPRGEVRNQGPDLLRGH